MLPGASGVTIDRLDAWWAANRAPVAAALPPLASDVVTPGSIQVGRRAFAGGAPGALVSAKEEADLEDLLSLFSLGLGEPEEFAARLEQERAALEAANVHGLLESAALADGVLARLRRAQAALDDLHEGLKVFDLKLRHMRGDVAAIEASNGALEARARDGAALHAELSRLLADIEVDPALRRALEAAPLDPSRLAPLVGAAWALHDRRRRLAPGGAPGAVNPMLAGMRAVRDARQELDALAQR